MVSKKKETNVFLNGKMLKRNMPGCICHLVALATGCLRLYVKNYLMLGSIPEAKYANKISLMSVNFEKYN